jgi:hypothetical protein
MDERGLQVIELYTSSFISRYHNMSKYFFHVTFDYVYRRKNQAVDRLSKARLALNQGVWKVTETTKVILIEYFHDTWL